MKSLSLKQCVIKRLRELQGGAGPVMPSRGVCYDLYNRLGLEAFCLFRDTFRAMGLDPSYPVAGEDEYDMPGKWDGERGIARRAFAGRVADYLEAQ